MSAATAAQKRADYVTRIVAAAPELSAAQRDRLAVLLRPATRGAVAGR